MQIKVVLNLQVSGVLYSWGWNNCGQLGLGDKINRSTPQEISALKNSVSSISCGGYSFCVAILSNQF